MKITIPIKSLVVSIIFFGLSCFIFIFLYRLVNNNKQTSQMMQEKLQTEMAHRESAKSLASSVKKVEQERVMLETHFVRSSDVVPFLDTIENLAKNVGTKSEVVSVDVSEDLSSLVAQMRVSGSFEAIYKLVLLLENSSYELEFISMDIQNSNTENLSADQNTKWNATFKIKLLSFVN